jgi:hypothetical protein
MDGIDALGIETQGGLLIDKSPVGLGASTVCYQYHIASFLGFSGTKVNKKSIIPYVFARIFRIITKMFVILQAKKR